MRWLEQRPARRLTVNCTTAKARCDCGVITVVLWNDLNGPCWYPWRCKKCNQRYGLISGTEEYNVELKY